jgi:hypothetical protein
MPELRDGRVRDLVGAEIRSGLFVPAFDALADPARVAALAAEAEEAGRVG